MNKRFVFFGTPYIASETLSFLLDSGFRPEVVVTSPDAPQGRGQHLAPSPTRVLAETHHIPVLTPERLSADILEQLSTYNADYAIVVAYGKILPKVLIESFPLGVLNIHYSLLPKYRGASPVEAVLLAGEQTTGVTIQKMVYELDAGDVIAKEETAIESTETTKELRARLIPMGAKLLVATLPTFLEGGSILEPQNEADATFCARIDKSEGELLLSDDAQMNWNKYRAYAESPGTYFFVEKNGKRMRVKIKTAKFVQGVFTPLRVVPEGKKETDYAEFVKTIG